MILLDYIFYEHWKELNSVIPGKQFQIHPDMFSVEINWKVKKNSSTKIKGLKMTQLSVNSNIETTRHTLQSQTIQYLIIGTWN